MTLRMNCKVIDIHSQLAYKLDMIHCICNNINSQDVDRAAANGAETADCVQRACGSEFNCGQCRDDITARIKLWYRQNDMAVAAE